jgi:Asp-tRNA(Asn)/Glu-tRNA(Gln) amidotransferase A subunit family amidase
VSGHAPLRLAFYPGPHTDDAQPQAVAALQDTWRTLRQAGIVAVPVTLPHDTFAALSDTNRIIMAYEGARELAPIFQRTPELLGTLTANLVQTGLAITPARYREAIAHAALCARLYAQLTQGIDAIITLSAPGEAPPRTEGTGSSIFNRAWTTMGLPCLTVPSGVGPTGLPLGTQLVGRAGHDAHLLQVGRRVAALLRGGGASIPPSDAFT